MPTKFCSPRAVRRYCRRAYTWSTTRGGCRFTPGHQGPCKPGRR